jgi:hypothetical protein
MLRRISYRTALTAFLFVALWCVAGAIILWSPLPEAAGIGGSLFGAWFILMFLALAVAGSLLTVAALNAAFPPRPASPPRRPAAARTPGSTIWAPPPSPRTPSRSGGTQRDG